MSPVRPDLLGSSDLSGVASLVFVDVHVPSVLHHELEVVVSIDAGGNVVVVFQPFVEGNHAVLAVLACVVSHSCVVLLEGVEELEEDVIFCLFACDEVGVFINGVSASNVFDIELAVLVLIHTTKGLGG